MQDFKRHFLFGVRSKILLFSFYVIDYESIKLFKWVCRLRNLKIWSLYFGEFEFEIRDMQKTFVLMKTGCVRYCCWWIWNNVRSCFHQPSLSCWFLALCWYIRNAILHLKQIIQNVNFGISARHRWTCFLTPWHIRSVKNIVNVESFPTCKLTRCYQYIISVLL